VSKHALRLLNHPEPANGDKGSVETAALRQEQALAPGGRLMLVLKSRAGVLCRHRVTPRGPMRGGHSLAPARRQKQGTASSATCAATEIALRAIDR
jgi:hypothetical protein